MQKVINGLLTTYLVVNPGQAYTLLILHGWGQNSSHWKNVLENLPQNVTGVALDLPAFGSTQPLPGNPSVPEYSAFVEAFIQKLSLKKIILLGHSYGGQVAVDFSLRYPKLLRHLILVSPACVRQSAPSKKSKINRVFKPLAKVLPTSVRYRLLQKVASENYLHSTSTQRAVLNRILYQDYSGKLKDISVPTSIIWGDKDITIPNDSKLLAEKIPQSELHVLYNADHSPHLTAPAKFISALNTILHQHAF